jgi:hypothetical protein
VDHEPLLTDLSPRYQPIDVCHVPICGFRQGLRWPTGTEILWQRLREQHHNGRVAVLDPQCWDDDWEAAAEFMFRFRPDAGRLRIGCYAYSWGAGWGAIQLARALRRRGLLIDVMVLCDPVYRHRCRIKNWRALWPASTILIPANVLQVHWLYQRQSVPRGHEPIAADPARTAIWGGHEIEADHVHMDEHPDYHRLALAVAKTLDSPVCGEAA